MTFSYNTFIKKTQLHTRPELFSRHPTEYTYIIKTKWFDSLWQTDFTWKIVNENQGSCEEAFPLANPVNACCTDKGN